MEPLITESFTLKMVLLPSTPQFFILETLAQAVKSVFQYRAVVNPNFSEHIGTSGTKKCFYLRLQPVLLFDELKLYHHILDRAPIIDDLDQMSRCLTQTQSSKMALTRK
ncbi:hypothetical protein L596_022809 [Steinernema carpocapsae]|uniref:Uncharacterized protein n=1 Tax=Steinernema carpocapsae TaxID=34508 RepID=A0A4V6A0L8_STECR|nr:hypothetical protein L596_022809 [Steinernema carpocapsae]